MVDRAISLIVALHATPNLLPRLLVDEPPIIHKMVTGLLKYLRPNLTVYHVRSVNLIWALEKATSRSHVESILARTMTSPESRNLPDAYDPLAVDWSAPILYSFDINDAPQRTIFYPVSDSRCP